MEEAVPNRRRLAPTSSEPTTAEIQAQRHGIPAHISSALQGGVGMRIRQAAGTGRQNAFSRTQSVPILQFGLNQPRSGTGFGGGGGFITHEQAFAEAQSIISREELRRREPKPFSSNDSDDIRHQLNLSPRRGSPDRLQRRLDFRPDGTVLMDGQAAGSSSSPTFGLVSGRKRGKEEADEDGEEGAEATDVDDDATEVDEDEDVPSLEEDNGSNITAPSSSVNEFPPVFQSPRISVPELFHAPQLPSTPESRTKANPKSKSGKGLMLPPPVPAHAGGAGAGGGTGRNTKFLPARAGTLAKTVSAPVFSGVGSARWDVDMESGETDGFDVSEWAKMEPQ